MDVSIVIPLHNPNMKVLRKIDSAISNQKFDGKIEVIKVKNKGLADSLNYGIERAKYPIVVSLHQDCVPSSKNWLKKLTEPLGNSVNVAAVSKVYLPEEVWGDFDSISKILSAKEQKVITPLMDEKGCAYRKRALIEAGLFDGKKFRTAGEDFDMYIKLNKIGHIVYPDSKVIHYHHYNWKSRIRKELQLSEAFGALVRTYGWRMPKWYVGILKSIPILGYPLFLASIDLKKLKLISLIGIPLMLIVSLIYSYGFWKGFLTGQQRI